MPAVAGRTPSYDMPLLPDDSETCVDDLGKALKKRGVELAKPNETCDAVYCYCGIRLHPLTCPDAFSVDQKGNLVGDDSVERLERNCLSSSSNVNAFPGLGGCNKCLESLHLVNFLLLLLSTEDLIRVFTLFWQIGKVGFLLFFFCPFLSLSSLKGENPSEESMPMGVDE